MLHTIKLLTVVTLIGAAVGVLMQIIQGVNYALILKFWDVFQWFSLSLQEAFDLLVVIEVVLIVLWLTLYCNIPRSKYGTLDENLIKHPHEKHSHD